MNMEMSHEEQVDQRLANYRPAEELAVACAMCVHFDAACGTCELVAGFVRVDYRCDLFHAGDLQPVTVESEIVPMSGEYDIVKSDDTQQIIFGWANIAITKSGDQTLDAHSDLIDAYDLEVAAYDFMLNARGSGEDHAGTVDAECVESIVFTKEKAAALGIPEGLLPEAGWWVGFHIPDRDAYLRAKAEKSMFSIEGTAVREPVSKID